MRKLIRLLFLLGLFLFLTVKPVQAQGEFATSYQVTYRVETDGLTHAKFVISLKNRLSNIYAKEFALSIGSTNLSQLKAYDNKGDLELKLNQGQKTTNLVIPFTDKILGKDQVRQFTVEFVSSDFADRSGQVWDITIPKLANAADLENYQLTLTIPVIFGQPSNITPTPVYRQVNDGYVNYRFNPADLIKGGISATFGTQQFFDFSLTYHLQNTNVYPVKTEIALPPDTAYQQVFYQTLDPEPTAVTVDEDGNWLASYSLSPRQNLTVLATGSAQINLKPDKAEPLTEEQIQSYLTPQQFWETDNPKIKDLAASLKTPQAIYQYVVDNLIYDYGRLTGASNRFGAANALDTPDSAICMEFTDLFIALSRAAGIPARAVNGYAHTNNPALKPLSLKKDVLHAWPEYYDREKQLWIPIDPTWGNTTGGIDYFSQFDLNHFAFVIQGLDSTYPIPAGAYKINGDTTKDVTVDFGQSVLPQKKVNLTVNLPDEAIAGVPIKGQVVLKNIGTALLINVPLTITSGHFSIKNSTFTIPQIPPFGQVTIPLELPATSWTDNLTDTVRAVSGKVSVDHTIVLKPAYRLLVSPHNLTRLAFVIGTVLLLGFGFTTARRFYKMKS